MIQRPIVVWLRQDLRLRDNAALAAAVAGGRPVVPVYVLDDVTPGRWAPGGASRWWLHGSLEALDQDIAERGGRLVLRRGRAVEQILEVAAACEAAAVYWNAHVEPFWTAAEADLARALADRGLAGRSFPGSLLFAPGAITAAGGEPHKVFTPFWKACLAAIDEDRGPGEPAPGPERLPAPAAVVPGERLGDWALRPSRPDWAAGLRDAWTPGEAAAHSRLDAFLGALLASYETLRNRPEPAATSRLSPHLHFGEVTARQVWFATRHIMQSRSGVARGAHAFLRELGWREFMSHTLARAPELPDRPLQSRFAAFPWRDDPEALDAWQQGRTGYPIVDAGMRQLWRTGWMHNRVRMITASFLIKHLLQPWQAGEAWFWDTLVDADLASNAGGWQWVAGCGTDAAPYFRIFNPTLQAEKFDPDGAYVRRWVPELAALPDRWLHKPCEAPEGVRADAGVRLGEDYPPPIVDHMAARKRALAAFDQVKNAA